MSNAIDTARKPLTCEICGTAIQAGDMYFFSDPLFMPPSKPHPAEDWCMDCYHRQGVQGGAV